MNARKAIALTDKQRNELAIAKVLWLKNTRNGRVIPWTAYLSVEKHMVDCLEDGTEINPKDVPADHPFIREQLIGLRGRIAMAGGSEETIQGIGKQLTDMAAEKFRAIEQDKRAELPDLSSHSNSQESDYDDSDTTIEFHDARGSGEHRPRGLDSGMGRDGGKARSQGGTSHDESGIYDAEWIAIESVAGGSETMLSDGFNAADSDDLRGNEWIYCDGADTGISTGAGDEREGGEFSERRRDERRREGGGRQDEAYHGEPAGRGRHDKGALGRLIRIAIEWWRE